jgi:Outer membrane protein beta-barrel domain
MFTKFMFVIGLIAMISVPSIVFAQDPGPPHGGGYAAPPPAAAPIQDPGATPALMHKGFIEGGIGVGGCNGDDCSSGNNSFDPGIGFDLSGFFLVSPTFAIGGYFAYQTLDPNIEGADSASYSSAAFGGEARLYSNVSPDVKLFGLIGFGVLSAEGEITGAGNTIRFEDDAKTFKVGAGLDIMVGPKLAFGGVLYYQYNSWEKENIDEEDVSMNYIYFGIKMSYFF